MFGVNLIDVKRSKSATAIPVAYTIAKFGSNEDTCAIATSATDNLIGVFQHTTEAAGEQIDVAIKGRSNVKLGGAIALGAFVTSDANGLGVAAMIGQNVIGRAMKAGVAGDIIPVELMPGTMWLTGSIADGHSARLLARASFNPSSNQTQREIGAHNLGVVLPNKAILTKAWYDVITSFTSATNTATIALHVQSPGDIVAAKAINASGNIWNEGIRGSKIGFPALGPDTDHDTAEEVAALFTGTYLKMTDNRMLTATVGVQPLTAGKLVMFVEYVMSE